MLLTAPRGSPECPSTRSPAAPTRTIAARVSTSVLYHLTAVSNGWTQGFFPGSLWLIAERERLAPGSLKAAGYSLPAVEDLARRWQSSFRHQTRPALNHDQGFRFQPCYGREFEFYGTDDARHALIEAAESLVDRYDGKVGEEAAQC